MEDRNTAVFPTQKLLTKRIHLIPRARRGKRFSLRQLVKCSENNFTEKRLSFEVPKDLSELSFDQIIELMGWDSKDFPNNNSGEVNANVKPSESLTTNLFQPELKEESSIKTDGILCRFDDWDTTQGGMSPTEPEFSEDWQIKQESEETFIEQTKIIEKNVDGNVEQDQTLNQELTNREIELSEIDFPIIKTNKHRGAVDINILLV